MIKLFKLLLLIAIASIGLLFFLLENPNRFKSELTEIVSLNTPYRVLIKGDLSWRYWPPIAIQAEDTVLLTPDGNKLAQIKKLEIDLDLISLLGRQRIVEINSLSISGGWINYELKRAGRSNWISPMKVQVAEKKNLQKPPTVNHLNLNDLTINYRAERSYTLLIRHLTTSKLAIDSPFDISTAVEILDNESLQETKIETTGSLIYTSTDRLRFNQTISTVRIEEKIELNIKAAGELHPDRQVILLNEADIIHDSILASITGIINFDNEPRFDGELNLEASNPRKLFNYPLINTTLQLTSGITASKEKLALTNINAVLPPSQLKGNLSIQMTDPPHLAGDLRFDQIILSAHKPLNQTITSSKTTARSTPELIPSALKHYHFDLILRANKVMYSNFDFIAAKVEINSNNNNLEVIANSKILEGKLVASLSSDWSDNQIIVSVDSLDVATISGSNAIKGNLSAHGEYGFRGGLLPDLEDNLTGRTVFGIRNGSIDVQPIKELAATIDSIRGKSSRISSWPDRMPFKNMTGQHLFQQGTKFGQVFNAKIDNLHLTASGGFNLAQETIDYDLTAKFDQVDNSQFNVSNQIAGMRWPMRCQGNFHEEPAELCFGQKNAIQDLVASMAKEELKRTGNNKLESLIEEKVPEQLQDIARDLLKDLFK